MTNHADPLIRFLGDYRIAVWPKDPLGGLKELLLTFADGIGFRSGVKVRSEFVGNGLAVRLTLLDIFVRVWKMDFEAGTMDLVVFDHWGNRGERRFDIHLIPNP